MNIFMPYRDMRDSVKALDDVRLNKQILECYQILRVALGQSTGYANHPITKHYIQYPDFLRAYGHQCCQEYLMRFHKNNVYAQYFLDQLKLCEAFSENSNMTPGLWRYVNKTPLIYVEFPKTDPRCIREHDEEKVLKLYQRKLSKKWDNDTNKGRAPRWTDREEPKFWKNL